MRSVSAILLLALGCAPATQAPEGFDKQLLEIARSYKGYGRVDDESRWAPHLCRGPLPSQIRFSASREESTHGRKLYFVLAKDREAYVKQGAQPLGQILVKESWKPEDAGPAPKPSPWEVDWEKVVHDPVKPFGEEHLPYAWKDGRLYRASEFAGLFIMLKAAASPETDEGWVYGTVSADLKTVTSSGRVASCMECHRDAPHDRLFGLPAGR